MNKALRKQADGTWDDPISECVDKVGVRADVTYVEDIGRLVDALMSNPRISVEHVDDKGETKLGSNVLGYRGTHLDVRPIQLPDGLDESTGICEIQIRTNAQAAWAMAFHDLSYKPVVDLSVQESRSINRLTVLMELFDAEVRNTRTEIMGKDGYPVAIVLRSLEALWVSYGGAEYDKPLSVARLAAVLGDITAEQANELAAKLPQWAEEHHAHLSAAFDAIDTIDLLHQPESMLLLYQISEDPFEAADEWVHQVGLPYQLVQRMAVLVDESVPAPQ